MRLIKCECGNIIVVRRNNLINGTTKSCGCYKKQIHRSRKLKPDGYSMMIQAYNTFKTNSKKRDIEIDITFDEWKKIGVKDCFYCGSKPSNVRYSKHNSGDYVYNGIDRIDNTLGYTLENSVPCCFTCNHSKSDMTLDQFLTWLNRVFKRRKLLDEFNRGTN